PSMERTPVCFLACIVSRSIGVLGGSVSKIALGVFLLGLAAMPWAAEAQTYSMRTVPVQYEVMPPGGFPGGDPAVELKTSSWGMTVAPVPVDLPFTFNFYGVPYDSMWVVPGYVTFGTAPPTLSV